MRGKSDCGAGEEAAVNQSNGDGRGKLLELVVNQLALSIFFNLFRPLVSHSLMSSPNSRLSIYRKLCLLVSPAPWPHICSKFVQLFPGNQSTSVFMMISCSIIPWHTAVVHQKVIFIRMPKEEAPSVLVYSTAQWDETFYGREQRGVRGQGWVGRLVFIIIFNLIFNVL